MEKVSPAVYEVETDDLEKVDNELADVIMKAREKGRGTDCVVPDRSVPLKRPYFKQITPIKKAPK